MDEPGERKTLPQIILLCSSALLKLAHPLLIGTGPQIGVAPAKEYTFMMMVMPLMVMLAALVMMIVLTHNDTPFFCLTMQNYVIALAT